MILETKGEQPLTASKIENDINFSLVSILLLKGKVVTFIVSLCRPLIVLPSLEKIIKVVEIFSLQI